MNTSIILEQISTVGDNVGVKIGKVLRDTWYYSRAIFVIVVVGSIVFISAVGHSIFKGKPSSEIDYDM
jgi:hypothetical protein